MKAECEQYQINLSAMLDGELKGVELADTVGHVAECGDCRRQLNVFRRMQELIDSEYSVQQAPANLWRRIERTVKPARFRPKIVPFKRIVWRIAAAAAVIAIVFGAGYFIGSPGRILQQDGEPLIKLTGFEQQMDEDRFLDMTRELLNSEPKYQLKMYMVLHTIYNNNIEGGIEPMMLERENETPSEGSSERRSERRGEMRF